MDVMDRLMLGAYRWCSFFDPGEDKGVDQDGCSQSWTGHDRALTPLMRAISAGHRGLAIQLADHRVVWKRDEGIECSHIGTYCTGKLTCEICPYGQRSPYELAINRGEIELLGIMFEYGIVERKYPRAKAPDLPRVLSYGNVMAERLELKVLLFKAYCEWDGWIEADEVVISLVVELQGLKFINFWSIMSSTSRLF